MAIDKGPPKGPGDIPPLGDELGRPGKPLGAIPIGRERFLTRGLLKQQERERRVLLERRRLGLFATDERIPRHVRASEVRTARRELLKEERRNVQLRKEFELGRKRMLDPDASRRGSRARFKPQLSQAIRADIAVREGARKLEAAALAVREAEEAQKKFGGVSGLSDLERTEFQKGIRRRLKGREEATRKARVSLGLLALDERIPEDARRDLVKRQRSRILQREKEVARLRFESGQVGAILPSDVEDPLSTSRALRAFEKRSVAEDILEEKAKREDALAAKRSERAAKERIERARELQQLKEEETRRVRAEIARDKLREPKKSRSRALKTPRGGFTGQVIKASKRFGKRGPKILTAFAPMLEGAFLIEEIKAEIERAEGKTFKEALKEEQKRNRNGSD